MSQFLLTFRTKYLITVSSVGITKMLMGGRCSRAKRAKKNFSGPSWGGQKKLIVWFNCDEHVPIYLQQFPSYSNRKCKKSPFSRTAATFLFPLETPLRLSPNMFHGWKDKRLAASTYLFSIASELYDAYKSMRKSQNRYFYHISSAKFR